MEEYSQLNWNDHSAVLVSKLHIMFETNAFVDLTLVSDEGLSIQVHRVIVCAASPYFQDLLSEHPADTHTTIILSNVSFEHLRALVEFIYKGTVYVPRSQLPDLLESATYMEIKEKAQGTVPKGMFNCDACGRVYKLKKRLNTHLKYECGKEPSFSCPLCNHRAALKSSLKKHLVQVHKMNDSQLASHGLGPKIYKEMPFKCHQCKRSYKRKSHLNRHIKDECGINPRFQCTQCDYRAKQKIHLRDHLTTIHGISPDSFAAHGVSYAFQCNICLFLLRSKDFFPEAHDHGAC